MSRTNSYKTYHGNYEELLTKNNYELWAPVIKRELQGKDQWGFIDGTRPAPEPLPPNSPISEQLLYRNETREHRADVSATGSYIFNACSKPIQDRYLHDLSVAEPKAMWDRLKTKLQGNDEESRTKLLTKFMTMKKTDDLTIEQFYNKLKTIKDILNGADGTFVSDKMVLERIFANAGPNLAYLTNELRSTPALVLATVLKRYELAEESLETIAKTSDDSVAALAVQNNSGHQIQAPRSSNLPVCPADWNGNDCWYHPVPNHKAVDCGALKEFQRRYLEGANIDPRNASKIRGYPPPGSLPRPFNNVWNANNNRSQSQPLAQNSNASNQQKQQSSTHQTSNQQSNPTYNTRKRTFCGLCEDPGHTADLCPKLKEAATALKRIKTAAIAVSRANDSGNDDIPDKDEVKAV